MNRTGSCPRESCPKELSRRRISTPAGFRHRTGMLSLAIAVLLASNGPAAWADGFDPTQPRVEEVLDVDGSVWKVLIVPRPLHHAAPRRSAPVYHQPSVHVPATPIAPPAAKLPVLPAAPKAKLPKPPLPKEPMPKVPEVKKEPALKKEPMPKVPEVKKEAAPQPKNNPQPMYEEPVEKPMPTLEKPKIKPMPPLILPAPATEKGAPAKAEKPEESQVKTDPFQTELISLQTEASEPEEAQDHAPITVDDPVVLEDAPLAGPPFGIEIVPRFSYPVRAPSAACITTEECPTHVNPHDYLGIYLSIPFIRSEYIANPSYRHEATMEMLFGKMRPTVVQKQPGQPRPHGTLHPYENDFIRPYSYYSLGAGAGYGRGPSPFAAPGAYGVNYNFYYPMPSVYRNY